MTWRPILASTAAHDALRVIADELARDPVEAGPWSLADGSAGITLFHAYARHLRSDVDHDALADRHLDHALDAVAEVDAPPVFFDGLFGVGWVAAHLRRCGLFEMDEADFAELDEAMALAVPALLGAGRYEHTAGVAGLALGPLERGVDVGLVPILDALERLAERSDEGATWFHAPTAIANAQDREHLPRGGYNLGVAHGVPGVIGVVSRLTERAALRDRARALLAQAVAWLSARRDPACGDRQFSYWIAPGLPPAPARIAWCYGAPGIAVAILGAARALGDDGLARLGVEIAINAARVPAPDTRVEDAGLCHGAAGVAHLYNRMFQATGEVALRDAALAWLDRALVLPCGGAGFLSGKAGVGLALLAALGSVEPAWDRCLLADLAPR